MKGINKRPVTQEVTSVVNEYYCEHCSFTTMDSAAAARHYGFRHSYVDRRDIDEVGTAYYIETKEDQELLYDHLTRASRQYVPLSNKSFIGANWYVTQHDYDDEIIGFQTVHDALDSLVERYQALEVAQNRLISLLTAKPKRDQNNS